METIQALERDFLEYQFSEDDDGKVDRNLLLMTPSSFMSPTREVPASLSPVDPIGLEKDYWRKDVQMLHESPRSRSIDGTMRVSFLSTLPEEEWQRYQSELERKAGVTWNRMTVMKVELKQPIMREVLGKLMRSVESDVLTESVSEDSADENQVVRKLPVRRAKKGLKRLKGRIGSKSVNQKAVKTKANAIFGSLAKVARPSESG